MGPVALVLDIVAGVGGGALGVDVGGNIKGVGVGCKLPVPSV